MRARSRDELVAQLPEIRERRRQARPDLHSTQVKHALAGASLEGGCDRAPLRTGDGVPFVYGDDDTRVPAGRDGQGEARRSGWGVVHEECLLAQPAPASIAGGPWAPELRRGVPLANSSARVVKAASTTEDRAR